MKFFVGLLLGVGVGVVVGLLLAPQSGEETRAQLSEQGISLTSNNLSDDLRARANAALAQGRDVYSRTKDQMNDVYNRTRSGNL